MSEGGTKRSAAPDRKAAARSASRNWLRWAALIVVGAGMAAIWIFLQANWPKLLERAVQVEASEAFLAPGETHHLGTDHEGREMVARVLVGAAGTICVALLAGLISCVAGTLLGIARSFAPGPVLRPAAVVARAWFCFPMFIVVAAFVSLRGGHTLYAFGVLAMAGSLMVGRGVAATLSRTMAHPSDKAALASAIPRTRLWRNFRLLHARYAGYRWAWTVLPSALLWESSLGFIGDDVAVAPYGLGHLVRDGRPYFLDAPWLVLAPGAALFVLIFLARIGEAATGARFERHYSLLNDAD